jgi:hypothetical protein
VAETDNNTCFTCRYFRNGDVIGTCKRFPTIVNKHQSDWCGEHDQRAPVAMPSRMDGDLPPIVELTARRGRPPKVAVK